MIEATSMPAGRFAGERYFPEREHVPQWLWDVSPRISMAYDLFGDGRTALKASFSRYLDPLTGGFADRYSPGAANETRNWFDCTINAAGNACATGVAAADRSATTSRRRMKSGPAARRSASAKIAISIRTF